MEVKLCSQEYVGQVGDLYDATCLYLNDHVNYPKWTYKQYPCLKDAIDSYNHGYLYICVNEQDKVVGTFKMCEESGGAYEKGNWSKDLKEGEYLCIHTLAVHPNYYGLGVGKIMLQQAEFIAKQKGYKALRLDIVPDNYPAINLYKSVGYTFAGQVDLQRNIKEIPEFVLYELNF